MRAQILFFFDADAILSFFDADANIVLSRCGRDVSRPYRLDLRHRWWLFVGIEGLDCAGYFAVVECVGQGHFELLYR